MKKKKRIVVLGLGVSGKAAASLLLHLGHEVVGVDQRAGELQSDPKVMALGIEVVTDCDLADVAQVVMSPGIPPGHELVHRAREKGIEVIGEVEFAFRQIQNRCIGVTGSNGKTTTVLLLEHVLKWAGKKARALGNVGVGLSSYLVDPDLDEILIVELSSFQLETLREKKLDAALIVNITPNHLNRHASMEEYAMAKISIQDRLKEKGKLFVSRKVAEDYGTVLKKYEMYDLAPISSMRYTSREASVRLGLAEEQNMKAALAVAKEFGIEEEIFFRAVKEFRKPPHRIEWVAEIDGVSYYNDSKSSNIDSVMHAMTLFDGPVVLIIGGVDKGSSYQPWIDCFRGKVKQIVAYGAAASKMEAELASDFPFIKVGPFAEAIWKGRKAAEKKDIVLLSPGCSSYDQFRSFEHRGDEFKRIVRGWEREWIEEKQS